MNRFVGLLIADAIYSTEVSMDAIRRPFAAQVGVFHYCGNLGNGGVP
jgi:hypothetical protein